MAADHRTALDGLDFQPVATVADLETLDSDAIWTGYKSFKLGDREPGELEGRAFWHGWRNAARDHGGRKWDDYDSQLAADILAQPWFREQNGLPPLAVKEPQECTKA